MNEQLRDIHLPQPYQWENLLQPGYWLVLLCLIALLLWIWRIRANPFSRHKRRALQQLTRLGAINHADANALLIQLLRHREPALQTSLNHNRNNWRRVLLRHNSRMPELAQKLAFHYRQSTALDATWLCDQLKDYIKGLK